MGDYQNIELVVPTGGIFNLSEFLEHREVVDVTVVGFFLLQRAKPGARELKSTWKAGKPELLLADVNSERSAFILRAPAVDIKFKKKKVADGKEVFFAKEMDVEIPAASAISYDGYKEFTFSGSFNPRTYRIDIPSQPGFTDVVVKFSVRDKEKDSVDPLACKNKILVPVYFNSKDDKSKKIDHTDLMNRLICYGYDVKNNKIAFWPDTCVVGFLVDKIQPCDIPFQYFDPISYKIEDNDYMDPFECYNIVIPITGGTYDERNANSIVFKKHGRCKFAHREGKDHYTQGLVYYSLSCDMKRHKDRVILNAEMTAGEELNATGILLQIVFFDDPKIERNMPICELPHMSLELETAKTGDRDLFKSEKQLMEFKDPRTHCKIYNQNVFSSNVTTKVDLPSAITQTDGYDKSSRNNKEEGKMSKKEVFGKVFGPIPSGVVAMDITGQLVIRPSDSKSYKRFDSKSGKMVDMLDHVFKLNSNLAYVLPVSIDTIVAGDIVVVANREYYVVKSIGEDKVIKGINLEDSTMLEIVPESLIGSDLSFVAKVINLLNPGKLDPMLMLMLMSDDEDEEEATMDTKTAMLMMMAMGNNNNSEGSNNNMNMMLPMMLMGDDDDGEGSNFKDLALVMMMNQNQNSNEGGCGMNMLFPMMLMDKSNGKKDMLLMMTMLQKQANLERTVQFLNKQKTEE